MWSGVLVMLVWGYYSVASSSTTRICKKKIILCINSKIMAECFITKSFGVTLTRQVSTMASKRRPDFKTFHMVKEGMCQPWSFFQHEDIYIKRIMDSEAACVFINTIQRMGSLHQGMSIIMFHWPSQLICRD